MPNEARNDDASKAMLIPEGKDASQAVASPEGTSKTYVVKKGDSLSEIAQREMGDGDRWQELYQANKAAIGDDPDLIHPGLELTIPA